MGIDSLQPWHWFALAATFFILEIFGIGGFLLGAGVAALAIAIVLALINDIIWQWQLAAFAILTVVFTLTYWKRFRKFNLATEQPDLNSGVEGLVGRETLVIADSVNGHAKVQLGDTIWSVAIEAKAGDRLRIIGADGVILRAQLIGAGV